MFSISYYLRAAGESLYWFGHGLKPPFMSRHPYFNFLTYHYFYIITTALLASACLSIGPVRIDYIDALFMGSGAVTQTGMNTIDVNKLSTWQQVVLYIFPIFTNPITINNALVFARILAFRKRFKDMVRESRLRRQTLPNTFSRSRTQARDVTDEERGIDGRNIVVMHGNGRPNTAGTHGAEMFPLHKEDSIIPEEPPSSSSSGSAQTATATSSASEGAVPNNDNSLKPQITFADQAPRSNGLLAPNMVPLIRANTDQHIAIVERQRNRELDAVLRIPSPRDAEKGVAPRALEDTEEVSQVNSRRASVFSRTDTAEKPAAPRGRAITIAEPPRPSETQRDATTDDATGAFRFRRPQWTRHAPKASGNDEDGADLRPIRSRIPTMKSLTSHFTSSKVPDMPYLSWSPTVGRNSNFDDLTEDQMSELGGVEYRALILLFWTNIAYFLGFTLLGIVGLLPWIMTNPQYGAEITGIGQGRPWWAIYASSSAFNDVGYTLTPDSMISFSTARWPLVLISFLVVLGNTGFPIGLRFFIWVTSKVATKGSGVDQDARFLLDHPRRCFTLLFPAKATWVLFGILIGLNAVDLFFFVILDLHNANFNGISSSTRVLDGWFQAVSTRTAGFAVVDLTLLHPAVQVSYIIMMYISILPIAISVRRTNVYEEQALGIYESHNLQVTADDETNAEPSYVGDHLRNQLSFDLPYITIGLFLICLIEGGTKIKLEDTRFSVFAILFEVISAYGTVGLSLGYTGLNSSFSTALSPLSKVVIIAMQIRGRHRGLPYDLDRAVLLPSERRQREEAEAAAQRIQRRLSVASSDNATGGTSLFRGQSRVPVAERNRNFVASLFHPGPSAPPMRRRTLNRDDMPGVPLKNRRTSFGATSMATGRDAEGGHTSFLPSFFSRTNNDNTDAQSNHRSEGRRSFYKEGVNPTPDPNASADPHPQKVAGKEA